MAKNKADKLTLDLVSLVESDPAVDFRGDVSDVLSIKDRAALAVSYVLREATKDGMSREDIAKDMSIFLGETVTKNMLDAYASQSRQDHIISLSRAMALVHVTGRAELFGHLLKDYGFIVVEEKYRHAIKDAKMSAVLDEAFKLYKKAEAERNYSRAKWQGGS